MKKIWVGILLIAGITMLLGGCGDDKSAKKPAEQPKVIKAGMNPDFAPFEFVDKDGKMVGFDVDLIQAVGKQMGAEVQLQNMSFDGLIPALQSGNLDVAISGMTITEERKKSIAFSDPYYKSGLVIVVKKENDSIKSAEDLKGKKLAAQIGTTGSLTAHKVEGATVTDFNNTPETFLDLKNGGVDAVINDLPVVQYFLKSEEGKDFKMVGELLETEYTGMGIDPKKKELVADINKALAELKKNGEYEKLYMKWFGTKPKE